MDGNGAVICVTSPRGGTGKTSMAVSIGAVIGAAGLRVCVIDLDLMNAPISTILNVISPDIRDLLETGQPSDPDTIIKNTIYSKELKSRFLLGPRRSMTDDYLPVSTLGSIVSTMRSLFDVIIINTPSYHRTPIVTDGAYRVADEIVLATDKDKTSIISTVKWLMTVDPALMMKTMIVMNKCGRPGEISDDAVRRVITMTSSSVADSHAGDDAGIDLIESVPFNDAVRIASDASSLGRILEDTAFRSAIATVVSDLLPDQYLNRMHTDNTKGDHHE
jgi:MinD-like ATPase involved in chromosome partitioning or flagellar assembly